MCKLLLINVKLQHKYVKLAMLMKYWVNIACKSFLSSGQCSVSELWRIDWAVHHWTTHLIAVIFITLFAKLTLSLLSVYTKLAGAIPSRILHIRPNTQASPQRDPAHWAQSCMHRMACLVPASVGTIWLPSQTYHSAKQFNQYSLMKSWQMEIAI